MKKTCVKIGALCTFLYALFLITMPSAAYTADAHTVQAETHAMRAQVDHRIQALLDKPDGIFDVEYKDGVLSRLKIKGTMEVSTSLRGARADRLARESAMRKARAAFSTFLASNVVFVESGNETVQIVEKNKIESASYQEASASSIDVTSQSFQRGLITVMQHFEGEGDRRVCVIILGWSQKLVSASQKAQQVMLPSPTHDTNSTRPFSPTQSGSAPGTSTKLGDMDF